MFDIEEYTEEEDYCEYEGKNCTQIIETEISFGVRLKVCKNCEREIKKGKENSSYNKKFKRNEK